MERLDEAQRASLEGLTDEELLEAARALAKTEKGGEQRA